MKIHGGFGGKYVDARGAKRAAKSRAVFAEPRQALSFGLVDDGVRKVCLVTHDCGKSIPRHACLKFRPERVGLRFPFRDWGRR